MFSNHNALGKKAEELACTFLIKRGLKLLTRNFRCRLGEIDLIMQSGEYIVFVEVRFRQMGTLVSAEESVNYPKREKIVKTAQYYLIQKKIYDKVDTRFDVLAVRTLSPPKMAWIQNAWYD